LDEEGGGLLRGDPAKKMDATYPATTRKRKLKKIRK